MDPEKLITATGWAGRSGARPLVEVQKLVMVSKSWVVYFLEIHCPGKPYIYLKRQWEVSLEI